MVRPALIFDRPQPNDGQGRQLFRGLILGGLTIALAACSALNRGSPELEVRPDDFLVLYEWQEGSLPPPYHYEYTIQIGPTGEGQVEMIPDYPADGVPVWQETFQLEPSEMDELYRLLISKGVFTEQWRAQDDPPVGGSSERLAATAHGRQVEIPAYVIAGQEATATELYAAIHNLVPQEIWDRLNARREQYVEEHS